ncbi:unnamed protein product [Pylaiella littoralis]
MPRLSAYEEAFDEDDEEEIGDTEEGEIIARSQASQRLYEDGSFPAKRSSLYRNIKSLPEYDADVPEVKWLYPHELCQEPAYFSDEPGSGYLNRGRLDDTWLLGALGVLASHPGVLIENLFASEPDDFVRYGVYTCRQALTAFYKNGEWQEVVTDTRIPCAHRSKSYGDGVPFGEKAPGGPTPMYGHGLNLNEQWVQMLEKAYAKLHGTYESINGGSVGEALVDLTGGCCEKISFTGERIKLMIEDGSLWETLHRCIAPDYVVACIQVDPNRGACMDNETGLLINHAYRLVDMKASGFTSLHVQECCGFRLVRLRNPWSQGEWKGDWSDASALWEDYPEVNNGVSSDPTTPWRRDSNDGTFWMVFSDFVRLFTKVYLCRVFPDEEYRQYCIHGEWSGKTAGGSARPMRRGSVSRLQKDGQDKMKDSLRRESVVDIQDDGDPYWFNNPQYRLSTDEPVEVYISLMQQDRRSANHLRENYRIAFEVVQTRRHTTHKRIWEQKQDDVTADSHDNIFASNRGEREVTRAGVKLDPRYAYNIVPHPMEQKREGKFTLRIFSKKDVCVEPVTETFTSYLHGSWDRTSDRDTAGGPLRLVDENKGVKNNPKWCQNPQYLLNIPARAQYESVDVKVVLRRQGDGSHVRGKEASGTKPRRMSLTHNALTGLVICKAKGPEEGLPRGRHVAAPRANALGEPLPTKASSLKRPGRRRPELTRKKDDQQTALPDRKIVVEPLEWCVMSDYRSTEVSTLMLKSLRKDFMPTGLFLVPTLSEKGVKGAYSLEIHSDHAVEVEELPEAASRTIAAEWGTQTAGGSHIHPDWKKNPCFHLKLRTTGPAKLRISVSRPEKDWKNKCIRDSVGCMMGFYLMAGPKPNRNQTIFHEGRPYEGSPMVPTHEVSTPTGFMLDSTSEDEVFTIMPATFEPGKTGPFFISIATDVHFSLRRDRGEASSKGASKNKRPSGHKTLTGGGAA